MISRKPFIKWAGGKEKEWPIIKENLPKQFINEAYISSVIRAGGCPIILPITNDFDTIFNEFIKNAR